MRALNLRVNKQRAQNARLPRCTVVKSHPPCRRLGVNPWLRRSPGGGKSNPLQYSQVARGEESARNAGDKGDQGLIRLEEAMATHSSILAQKIPWTEELDRLHPWGRKDLDTTERLSLSLNQGCKSDQTFSQGSFKK